MNVSAEKIRPGTPTAVVAKLMSPTWLSDFWALGKPGIVIFSVITAMGGFALAPGQADFTTLPWLLVGTAFIVAAANTLNMYVERESDCLMARTATRPLPAGRMVPHYALWFGVTLALIAIPLLSFGCGALTGLLAALAFISYVMIYTPMKSKTTYATLVGSFPGAMPVAMGWAAAEGSLSGRAIAVYAVMFLWQIPHFFAISIYRRKEYTRAGVKILPVAMGERSTRYSLLFYLALQIQMSLLLHVWGIAGKYYLASAALLGGFYFIIAAKGIASGNARWAKQLFLISLLYLPLLFAALMLDRTL